MNPATDCLVELAKAIIVFRNSCEPQRSWDVFASTGKTDESTPGRDEPAPRTGTRNRSAVYQRVYQNFLDTEGNLAKWHQFMPLKEDNWAVDALHPTMDSTNALAVRLVFRRGRQNTCERAHTPYGSATGEEWGGSGCGRWPGLWG